MFITTNDKIKFLENKVKTFETHFYVINGSIKCKFMKDTNNRDISIGKIEEAFNRLSINKEIK